MRGTRGMTLLDLLCGTVIGLVISGAALAAVGAGLVAARTIGARGEADDLAQGAVEAFAFDVRRLGYDPRATGGPTLAQALPDRFTLQSDLDGDGTVDASSEETIGWVCNHPLRRLSRIAGSQSLPLADNAVACTIAYLDASGTAIAVPAAGLSAGARTQVRAIALDLSLEPRAATAVSRRRIQVALRTLRS